MNEKVRFHILISWLSVSFLCVILTLFAPHLGNKGLETDDVDTFLNDLIGPIIPTLSILMSNFFYNRKKDICLSDPQKHLALFLSWIYLFSIVAITILTNYIQTDLFLPHGKYTNNFSLLSPWQALVVGPIMYIFGASSRSSELRHPS